MKNDNTTYPHPDKKTWLARIQKDLKDTDLAAMALQIGGIDFPRFSHREDLRENPAPMTWRKGQTAWTIQSRINAIVPERANKLALEELNGGVQAIWFTLDQNIQEASLDKLFAGVTPEYIDIHWTLGRNVDKGRFLDWWNDFLKRHSPGDHSITFDGEIPNGTALPSAIGWAGSPKLAIPEQSVKSTAEWIEGLVSFLDSTGFTENPSFADRSYVRMITPVGADLLWETARLRATRTVLANIGRAFGFKDNFFSLDTVTSDNILDLSVNDHKIATPVVAMSAVLGGADGICLPISLHADDEKEGFHRRIARNTHHLMLSESGLGKVTDPAAGSYFFETLTERIATDCWEILQSKFD